jgi:hypothetical protein
LCGDPSSEDADAPTLAFMEAVAGCAGLCAVLSGHIHTAQALEEGGAAILDWRRSSIHDCLHKIVSGGEV